MNTLAKVLSVSLLALFSLTSVANQCYDLDSSQQKVLAKAYEKGKAHNLSYTMMAIAMEETTAGKYRMSFETKDYGVMQNNIKTASSRMGVKGYYNKLKLAERLIKDDNLSMSLALEELLYWKKHTPNWRGMVSAYNNGWAWSKGSVYLNKIIKHVNTFMKCWEQPVSKLQADSIQRIIDFHGLAIVLPDEVEYVAMDADGEIWGFKDEPVFHEDYFYPPDPDSNVILIVKASNPEVIDWEDSLVKVK